MVVPWPEILLHLCNSLNKLSMKCINSSKVRINRCIRTKNMNISQPYIYLVKCQLSIINAQKIIVKIYINSLLLL